MAAVQTAPYIYHAFRTDYLDAGEHYRWVTHPSADSRIEPVVINHPDIWQRQLKDLLWTVERGRHEQFGRVARLEFFLSEDFNHRGVTIFDSYGKHIIHVLPALLGQAGDYATLAWQIADLVGVETSTLERINTLVSGRSSHRAVFSRELHERIGGEDIVTFGTHVQGTWDAWAEQP